MGVPDLRVGVPGLRCGCPGSSRAWVSRVFVRGSSVSCSSGPVGVPDLRTFRVSLTFVPRRLPASVLVASMVKAFATQRAEHV